MNRQSLAIQIGVRALAKNREKLGEYEKEMILIQEYISEIARLTS